MNMINKVKYLIVGAGISGLKFAGSIRSKDYLILEKENDAGGYCRSIYENGFVWDYAGHLFHFSTEEMKDFFKKTVAAEDVISIQKNTKIYYKGNYIDYPFQKNIYQLPKNEFIDCLYDLFNRPEKKEYTDFEEMLYGKFGKSITEKFLKPYNEKLYACSLSDLDVNAMGRFFPYADIKDIIDNMKTKENHSYNDEFFSFKHGAETFVNALKAQVETDKIQLNQEVQEIDLENHLVRTEDMTICYDFLINTSPFNRLIRCTNQSRCISDLDKLSSNKILVINLGFDKKSRIDDIHWIYVPDQQINFYRIGFYDNIWGTDRLSMYVEIGYPSQRQINVPQQLDLTLANLKEMGIISDQKLVSYHPLVLDPAYVQISEAGEKLKETIKDELKSNGVFTIGRYGDWKYCSMEDSMLDAVNLANLLDANA